MVYARVIDGRYSIGTLEKTMVGGERPGAGEGRGEERRKATGAFSGTELEIDVVPGARRED